MKIRSLFALPVVTIAIALSPVISQSRVFTLEPSLSIGGRYDDNVYFSNVRKEEDVIALIHPRFEMEYKTERSSLSADAQVAIFEYVEQDELDRLDHRYALNGWTNLSTRLTGRAEISYLKDTLLDSELQETGRVSFPEDRQRYRAGAGLSYRLTSLSTIGTDYVFSRVDYDNVNRSDRDSNTVNVHYRRKFNDDRDEITIMPSYTHWNTQRAEADSINLNLGWQHAFSEVEIIRLLIGGRYTEEKRPGRPTRDSQGMVADASYEKAGEYTTFRIGYRRDLAYNANDELFDVNRFYSSLRYSFSAKLAFSLTASYYLTRSEYETGVEDSRYLELSPQAEYRLAENYFLRLLYQYARQDIDEPNETIDRNIVQLMLVLAFPKEL